MEADNDTNQNRLVAASLHQLSDWHFVVSIDLIEKVIVKFSHEVRLIKENHMRCLERSVTIVKVRYQPEIVHRHISHQLHVLNQSPQSQEPYISEIKQPELTEYQP